MSDIERKMDASVHHERIFERAVPAVSERTQYRWRDRASSAGTAGSADIWSYSRSS